MIQGNDVATEPTYLKQADLEVARISQRQLSNLLQKRMIPLQGEYIPLKQKNASLMFNIDGRPIWTPFSSIEYNLETRQLSVPYWFIKVRNLYRAAGLSAPGVQLEFWEEFKVPKNRRRKK